MGVAPVGPRLPESLHGPVTEAAGQAFLNGVHAAVWVTACLCVAGAVASAWVLRRPVPAPE